MSLLAAISSSRRRSTVAYDADAASYFAAVEAVSTISATAKNAANAYIVGLKAASLWTLIHQLYLYAGPNTLAGALVKAKGAGTRVNGGFAGGDFSPTLGLKGNGTSKYVNNNFLASSFNSASNSIFIYSSSGFHVSGDAILSGVFMGGTGTSLLALDCFISNIGRAYRSGTYTSGNFPVLASGLITSGSVLGSRTSGNLAKLYQNGAPVASSSASVIFPSFTGDSLFSFGLNNFGNALYFSSDQRQVEAFAAGLNDSQAQALHDLTTTYVNALNY